MNPRHKPKPYLEKHRIKKGEVRNPYGQAGKNKDAAVRTLKRFGKKELTLILDLVLTSNIVELNRISKDQSRSAFTQGVARALANACRSGNWFVLEAIVTKMVGNQPIRIDHTTDGKPLPDGHTNKVMLYLPKNGRTKEEVAASKTGGNAAADDGYDLGF